MYIVTYIDPYITILRLKEVKQLDRCQTWDVAESRLTLMLHSAFCHHPSQHNLAYLFSILSHHSPALVPHSSPFELPATPPQKSSSGRLHVIPAAQKAIFLLLDLGNHSNITSQASFLGASMNFCAHIHWSLIVIIFHMSVSYTKLHVPWRWEPYLLHFGIHSPSTVPACCMRLMTAKKQ